MAEEDHAQVWFPAPVAYAVGFALGWGVDRLIPWRIPSDPATWGLGGLCLAAGAVLAAWALGAFRRAGTSPDPPRPVRRLVTDGPYRYSRHPQYVALALTYLGAGIVLRAAGPLVLLPIVLAVVARDVAAPEEAYLERRFGSAYALYRRRVPQWWGRPRAG
ncbi:MAG: isoprenylcysteine carboxylmethyltransferase family protein [Actinomycetia bacterium]|nr:isoprenylcysteine carboxylmethyltransferase family protein [Actinomycetes bacterium]